MIGGGTAACSSDASRLSDPFTNPFSSSEPAATGSLPEGEDGAMRAPTIRTPRVQSQELAAPGAISTPRPAATAHVAAAEPIAGAVDGMNPGAPRAMTPRVAPAAPQPKLVFGKGPKGVEKPADRAAEAKREAEARKEAEAKKAAEARREAEARKEAEAKKHAEAKQAETRHAEARKAAEAKHADARKPEPKKPEPKGAEKGAEKTAKPDAREATRKEAEAKAAKAEAAKKVAEAKAAESAAKASAKESAAKEAKQAALAPKEAEKPVAKAVEKAPEPASTGSTASNDSFRWPAKGRVINGYGSSGNEGINIAVPEGTPVKAAEDGTVAYAGSDVKGYGKLVLVRHANGYVSAYAHNGELDVRPGDKVKRGQVIAKSGATGNVTSPQLHFEIRKGATPVDPIPHLASN